MAFARFQQGRAFSLLADLTPYQRVFFIKGVVQNPALSNAPGLMDAIPGNLYLRDGDRYEQREIMA